MNSYIDPVAFVRLLWPDIYLYDKQREIMYSLVENDETIVPAGNMLGKDFTAGLAALYFFMTRHPCRVVTTSVDQGQLEKVLWGEINRFIQTAAHALPLRVNHCDVKKIVDGKECPLSYLLGRVAGSPEGLLGHHLPWGPGKSPRTLMMFDEGSGIDPTYKEKTDTWVHRTLTIGNPYPCENHFKIDSKAGDVPRPNGQGYYKKVIRIRAEDSPNVRLGLSQEQKGKPVTDAVLVPGVLMYSEYLKRRSLWDPIRQCVSLDAQFYEGAEVLMYPPAWLNAAELYARTLVGKRRIGRAIGVDAAMGGDKTSMTAVDELGIIEQQSKRTPDTSKIPGEVIAFARKHNVDAENVLFDAGGGGKQHADRLRARGFNCRIVFFGEAVTPEPKSGMTPTFVKKQQREQRVVYKNRRAEMYGILRELLDPANGKPWAIPAALEELRRQLSPIPLQYDGEGRLWLPPKHKRTRESKEVTMQDLIGCSPDEADSTVLAVYGMVRKPHRNVAG